jgi:hypothetical protein
MVNEVQICSCVIDAVGETALDILAESRDGKVLAAVTQAVYLLTEQQELLWLATQDVPMHWRGMRVCGELPRPVIGSWFQARAGKLLFESGETLALESCSPWRTPQLQRKKIIPSEHIGRMVSNTYSHLLKGAVQEGMGALIRLILKGGMESEKPFLGDAGMEFCHKPVLGIVQACRQRNGSLLLKQASKLIGLGSGLTPSGDDFLGGLFFAFEILRQAYPEIRELQNWNYSQFILEQKSKTNVISACLLSDHAAGHGMEPLHRFINALLEGRRIDECLPIASEVVMVGHSTGWDLLTGLLAGMMNLAPQA